MLYRRLLPVVLESDMYSTTTSMSNIKLSIFHCDAYQGQNGFSMLQATVQKTRFSLIHIELATRRTTSLINEKKQLLVLPITHFSTLPLYKNCNDVPVTLSLFLQHTWTNCKNHNLPHPSSPGSCWGFKIFNCQFVQTFQAHDFTAGFSHFSSLHLSPDKLRPQPLNRYRAFDT